jgi:hypothetical protein
MGTFTPHRGTHRFISNDTPISWASSPTQGHTHRHTHLMGILTPHRGTHIDTPISWASSPHTGAHNVPSQSQRGTTHPSHGHTQLMGSLIGPTHSVCVLEDVSRSCNHQHQAKSLTKVLELHLGKRFGEDICNLLMCRKVLHVYYFPLHHLYDIMIFHLNVF